MRPRGFGETWVRVGLISGFGFTFLSAATMGLSPAAALPLGCMFGTAFGLAMAPMLSATTLRMAIPDARRDRTVHDFDLVFSELDYHVDSSHDGYRHYTPASAGNFNSGNLSLNPRAGQSVTLVFRAGTVTLVGPRTTVRKAERRFREL